jgi:hypothetical protein
VRILVTGSRTWTDTWVIRDALYESYLVSPPGDVITVVHGDCPRGADFIADEVARELEWITERHPADWEQWGKAAGFMRNIEMVKAGADICLAFIRDNSRGATHCADAAERSGIPTRRYRA